jgi:hypothetical protein
MRILEDNDTFTFWEEEDVVCFKYKQKIITLDVARLGVAIRLRVSQEKPTLMYVDLSNVNKVTKESRDYYASHEATQFLLATAVYTPSQLTRTLCTFFKNFNKPNLPFQYFCNKEKAFTWLQKFSAENYQVMQLA